MNVEREQQGGISSVVSNRNHPRRFLPCAATLKKSNGNLDEDGTSSSKGKYDAPLKVLKVPPAWWIQALPPRLRSILLNFCSRCRYGVSDWVVVQTIRMDHHDPIDGLRVLLDVSRAWRMILSITGDKLYDAKEFDVHYGKSYLRKTRMDGVTDKGNDKKVKKSLSRITTRLWIIRILADLKDPNDGLKIMSGALELWRTKFSSNELNDSEGYLQKEIFAIHDLSHRISVSNRNGKHDEAKNPPSQITHLLALYKLMIDNFQYPNDVVMVRREAFRCYIEGVECDGIIGLLVDAVAKLNFDDNDGYLWKDIFHD